MENYVDGFLLALPQEQLEAYRELAELAGRVWREHGALAYQECVGDDLAAPGMRSFVEAAGAEEGEVVVFAWIVYPSRAERDRINAAVLADPRMQSVTDPARPQPFDCRRMACGGFRPLVVA